MITGTALQLSLVVYLTIASILGMILFLSILHDRERLSKLVGSPRLSFAEVSASLVSAFAIGIVWGPLFVWHYAKRLVKCFEPKRKESNDESLSYGGGGKRGQ